MNVAVYAYEYEREMIQEALECYCRQRRRRPVVSYFEDYDSFIRGLLEYTCEVVLVARNGADGMEGARAGRDLQPRAPLVWFSDDNGFGPQSYRLGCVYFSPKPVTQEKLVQALGHCGVRQGF